MTNGDYAALEQEFHALEAKTERLAALVVRLQDEHRPYRKPYGRIQRCLKCSLPYPCPTRRTLLGEA